MNRDEGLIDKLEPEFGFEGRIVAQEENWKLRRKDFIPIRGLANYRRRTGAPVANTDSRATYREILLSLYNVSLIGGSAVGIIYGIGKLIE